MKIFVAAHLDKWESYVDIEEKLRANPDFCSSINLSRSSISGSQLNRRINDLPTEWAQILHLETKTSKTLWSFLQANSFQQAETSRNQMESRLHLIKSSHLRYALRWGSITLNPFKD